MASEQNGTGEQQLNFQELKKLQGNAREHRAYGCTALLQTLAIKVLVHFTLKMWKSCWRNRPFLTWLPLILSRT